MTKTSTTIRKMTTRFTGVAAAVALLGLTACPGQDRTVDERGTATPPATVPAPGAGDPAGMPGTAAPGTAPAPGAPGTVAPGAPATGAPGTPGAPGTLPGDTLHQPGIGTQPGTTTPPAGTTRP